MAHARPIRLHVQSLQQVLAQQQTSPLEWRIAGMAHHGVVEIKGLRGSHQASPFLFACICVSLLLES